MPADSKPAPPHADPSHDWVQDDDGRTSCTGCECYPYDAAARRVCAPWRPSDAA